MPKRNRGRPGKAGGSRVSFVGGKWSVLVWFRPILPWKRNEIDAKEIVRVGRLGRRSGCQVVRVSI